MGDCTVRAVSKALGMDWDTAYLYAVVDGFIVKDMPSSNSIWGDVLEYFGFRKRLLADTCPHCYTAEDFCHDHPYGTYILGFGTHVATVIDGDLYDAWDSSQEIPQYYWFRRET